MKIFLVLGYGVPKNIFQDAKYDLYLNLTFNLIFDKSKNSQSTLILFCGGRTDIYPPYRRTEAEEMIKLFRSLQSREYVKDKTKHWHLLPERKSLSTLENLLYSREIFKKKGLEKSEIGIIYEKTRTKRIKTLASRVFEGKLRYFPLDFNRSPSRFLPPRYIAEKEKVALKVDLSVLEGKLSFKDYHKMYQEKFAVMRRIPEAKREEAIRLWWDEKLGTSVNKYL